MLLLGLALCGCTGVTPVSRNSAQWQVGDYYPLKVGTQWTYEVALLGEVRTMTVSILRQRGDGFVEDSTGAQLRADEEGIRDSKRYLLRTPLTVGSKWTHVVSVSSVETYEIVEADVICESPAGRWSGCIVVQSRNRVEEGVALVNEMTFAPGIGLVRIATSLDSRGVTIPQSTLSLLRFAPAS